jgi:hypothetical protein
MLVMINCTNPLSLCLVDCFNLQSKVPGKEPTRGNVFHPPPPPPVSPPPHTAPFIGFIDTSPPALLLHYWFIILSANHE